MKRISIALLILILVHPSVSAISGEWQSYTELTNLYDIKVDGDNIWFGQEGCPVKRFTKSDSSWMTPAFSGSLVVDDDVIWSICGTTFSKYYKNNNTATSETISLSGQYIEKDGDVLWLTSWGNGIGRYHKTTGQWTYFTQASDGIISDHFRGLAVDDDAVWFVGPAGISRYDKVTTGWTNFNTDNSDLANNYVWLCAVDGNTVWFPTLGGGISKYDKVGNTWTTYDTSDGVISVNVRSVAVDGDHVWFGTEKGTSVYDKGDGSWTNFDMSNSDLTHNYVKYIASDSDSIWLGTEGSINRFVKEPTPTPTPTPTPSPTPTPTPIPTPTPTPIPTPTPTPTPTSTPTPTPVPTPIPTPIPTPTPLPTSTPTPTPVPTQTPTPIPTPTPAPSPTSTPTPEPVQTPSPTPNATVSPVPNATITPMPSPTPLPTIEPPQEGLGVSATFEPSTIFSGEDSLLNILVTFDGEPLGNASITLIPMEGSFYPPTGISDKGGGLKTIYSAPKVDAEKIIDIEIVIVRFGHLPTTERTNITVRPTPPENTVALVLDPNKHPLISITHHIFSTVTRFWLDLNAQYEDISIVRGYPGDDLSEAIATFSPKVIILSDNILQTWELDENENFDAIKEFTSKGGGLVLTHGTMSDIGIPQKDELICPSHHLGLYSEDSKYKAEIDGLATLTGLGLMPIYEKVKTLIADAVEKSGKQGKVAASFIRNTPLMIPYATFNGSMEVLEDGHPLLDGLESQKLELAIDCPVCTNKDDDYIRVHYEECLYCNRSKNTPYTTVGWQLEYPELVACYVLRKSSEAGDGVVALVGGYSNITSTDVNASMDPRTFVKNGIELSCKVLEGIYEARSSLPTITVDIPEITLFTPEEETVYEGGSVSVVLPEEVAEKIGRVLKPAKIVAISEDKKAAILGYEGTYHRSSYFTFKPESTSNEQNLRLIFNAISWTSTPPVPPPSIMDLIHGLVGERAVIVVGEQAADSDAEAAKEIEAYLSKVGVNVSIKLDVEVTRADKGSSHLFVVGGPSVNSVARELNITRWDFCKEQTYPCVNPTTLIQAYRDKFVSGRHVILAAGWEAEHTTSAGILLGQINKYNELLGTEDMTVMGTVENVMTMTVATC